MTPIHADAPITRRRVLAGCAALAGLALPVGPALALPPSPIRVSGSGWFRDLTHGGKVTFAFHVQLPPNPVFPAEPIRGAFELHDHLRDTRIHSTSLTVVAALEGEAQFSGFATRGRQSSGEPFAVHVFEGSADEAPFFSIASATVTAAGAVQGGRIRIEGVTSVT